MLKMAVLIRLFRIGQVVESQGRRANGGGAGDIGPCEP